MKPPLILVLWLDDELNDVSRHAGLHPWLEVAKNFEMLELHLHSDLPGFANALCEGETTEPDQEPRRAELLIIDLMLDFEDQPNFGELDFAKEKLIPQSAGAQIAGLIRSSRFDGERPDWLERYRNVPILMLSSSPTMDELIPNQVGLSRMEGIRMVPKALCNGAEPSPEFKEAMDDLLKQVEARRAAGR